MTAPIVREIPLRGDAGVEAHLAREWLVTNGLGGYASGTIPGANTRKYHGVLVAALPTPLGRMVMLQNVMETVCVPGGEPSELGAEERLGREVHAPGLAWLRAFRLVNGLPVWEYEVDGARIEKRVLMGYGQNTTVLSYRLLAATGAAERGIEVRLRPLVHFRSHEESVRAPHHHPYRIEMVEGRVDICSTRAELPPLRLRLVSEGSTLTLDAHSRAEHHFRVERARGYESEGDVWTPGAFAATLAPGRPVHLVASVEPWEAILALEPGEALAAEEERRRRLLELAPEGARSGVGAELVLAADQFIVTPAGRAEDAARARAAGDEARTVIAGYHWFTDWGRDTMISLEGLTLCTGRHREAGYILRTFARYVRDGLIPNMFPDGSADGLYHTADATLWFFHAVQRYVRATGDERTLARVLPVLRDIAEQHLRGTRFGIGVDPEDGLLRQGAEGYQLTWMDAKVDDWVVTPRRGKAVEINALWYNALRLLASWVRAGGDVDGAARLDDHARRAREAFNRRFWFEEGGYLYDVIDGERGTPDDACRPNQLLAMALDHPVLERDRWHSVMRVATDRLLTPVGLRSLAPGHADYKARYYGDLRSRDAAYHQGTVWGWLIGPYVDAWLALHPDDRAGARRLLDGLVAHLDDFGVGSVAEIFDAEPPYTPRGCIAQAWSVAELLRCWLKTSP